jgi:hypothetical protein
MRAPAQLALAAFGLALTVATGGCFDPIFPNGKIACTTSQECPGGFDCSNGLCFQPGADGSPPQEGGTGGTSDAKGGASGAKGGAGGGPGSAGSGGSSGRGGNGGQGAGGAAARDGGTATDGGCQSACAAGDQKCGTNGVETCVSVGGCLTWSTDMPCPGRQTCLGNAPTAACKCPAPPGDCTGAGKTCVSGALVTCAVDGNSCIYASATTTCASNEPCGVAFPNAACQCPAKPAACSQPGTYCDPSNNKSVITCEPDAADCLVITGSTPCTQPCTGTAGTATCGACSAAPAECKSAGTLCTSGQLEKCGLDGNGCLAALTTTMCTSPTTCQGALPNGACVCPQAPSECTAGAGTYCLPDLTGTITCGMVNGCLVMTTSATCALPQTCAPATGACTCPTVAACQAGEGSYCDSSGGTLITCAKVSGCIQSSTKACQTGLTCGNTSFPTGACQCPTPPMNCPTAKTYCQSNTLIACTADTQSCLHEADTNCASSGLVCGASSSSFACVCPAPTGGCGSSTGTTCSSDTAYLACNASTQGCIQGQTTTCGTGQYCWHTTVTCAAPSPVGYPTDLGSTGSRSGTLLGQSFTLTAGTTVRSFGLLVPSAGSQVSMGLYSDQSGSPYQLVASAQSKAVLAGTNVYPAVAAAGQSLTIATTGTYWIMALFDVATTVRQAPTTGPLLTIKYLSLGFGGLPTTLSGVLQQTGEPASNYYVLITQ